MHILLLDRWINNIHEMILLGKKARLVGELHFRLFVHRRRLFPKQTARLKRLTR